MGCIFGRATEERKPLHLYTGLRNLAEGELGGKLKILSKQYHRLL